MNADPALPVSTTKGAGVFQKINSKSFPDDIREKFGYIIWSLHKTIPLFTKETYNSTKTEKFYSCFPFTPVFDRKFSHPSNFTG